jgi:hypothetical protein
MSRGTKFDENPLSFKRYCMCTTDINGDNVVTGAEGITNGTMISKVTVVTMW